MTEYELYLPLHYNNGRRIERKKVFSLKRLLVKNFGGLTHFPQENEGLWQFGSHVFRDRVVILRVLSDNRTTSEKFFTQIKRQLKREWKQKDVLIISRQVQSV